MRQLFKLCMVTKNQENNSFLPWIVSSLEYFPHSNFQKRIVSAETIRGNTVFGLFNWIFVEETIWENTVQLNKHETAPNFIQLSQISRIVCWFSWISLFLPVLAWCDHKIVLKIKTKQFYYHIMQELVNVLIYLHNWRSLFLANASANCFSCVDAINKRITHYFFLILKGLFCY